MQCSVCPSSPCLDPPPPPLLDCRRRRRVHPQQRASHEVWLRQPRPGQPPVHQQRARKVPGGAWREALVWVTCRGACRGAASRRMVLQQCRHLCIAVLAPRWLPSPSSVLRAPPLGQVGMDSPGPTYNIPTAMGKQQLSTKKSAGAFVMPRGQRFVDCDVREAAQKVGGHGAKLRRRRDGVQVVQVRVCEPFCRQTRASGPAKQDFCQPSRSTDTIVLLRPSPRLPCSLGPAPTTCLPPLGCRSAQLRCVREGGGGGGGRGGRPAAARKCGADGACRPALPCARRDALPVAAPREPSPLLFPSLQLALLLLPLMLPTDLQPCREAPPSATAPPSSLAPARVTGTPRHVSCRSALSPSEQPPPPWPLGGGG